MNSNAIENLLLQKEGMNVEFKRAGNGPQNDTFETICAFLNRYGGDLLLGVTDDGEVMGLPAGAVENMKRHLVNVVSDPNQFAPPQVLFPECVECRGKTIIHVHIPQSAEVHRYKGVCYDRAHDADVKIDSTDAIAHRNYASTSSVQVELFKDRLEVYSPGPLHREMKPELLSKRHESHPNNPLLARALYLVKYIEDAGSGTTDMFRICQETGLSAPQFEYDAQHVRVTIERPTFDATGTKVAKNAPKSDKNIDEVAKMSFEIDKKLTTEGVRRDMRANMLSVFSALSNDPTLTIEDLMPMTSLSFGGVRNALSALKAHNLIRREGGDRGGHWQILPKGGRA